MLRLQLPKAADPFMRRALSEWETACRPRCDNCAYWDPALAEETFKQNAVAAMMSQGVEFGQGAEGKERIRVSRQNMAACSRKQQLVIGSNVGCEDHARSWPKLWRTLRASARRLLS